MSGYVYLLMLVVFREFNKSEIHSEKMYLLLMKELLINLVNSMVLVLDGVIVEAKVFDIPALLLLFFPDFFVFFLVVRCHF